MQIDKFGIPVYNSADLEDIFYQGNHNILDKILVDGTDPEIIKYNQTALDHDSATLMIYESLNLDITEFDCSLQQNWIMPEEYKTLDIETFLFQNSNTEHHQRLAEELAEFQNRKMMDLLRWMKYFVDTCRQQNIVWGVGRGSSVASYALYIIGVHKIDPIKNNLDWRDFLR